MMLIVSLLAKKLKTVDDDDIMLPLRDRHLPSFIAIDDTSPLPKPSCDAGFYLPLLRTANKVKVTSEYGEVSSTLHFISFHGSFR